MITLLPLLLLVCIPRLAHAEDTFEMRVYDGTANGPGIFALDLHMIRFATGHTTATPPELPLLEQFHGTLEASFGVAPWWEIGGYFQTSTYEGISFDYAGIKLRSTFVTPPSWSPHWNLGVNVAFSVLPPKYYADQFVGEVRPIVAWHDSDWLFAVNPIVGVPLAGASGKAGPTFDPAVKVARKAWTAFAFGVEYYGSIGPIASPAAAADQSHVLLGTFDILQFHNVEIDLGLGGGLTQASAGLVGKAILSYTYDKKLAEMITK